MRTAPHTNAPATNVISMMAWKDMHELEKSSDAYRHYLRALQNDGLMMEVRYFMDDIASTHLTPPHLDRGKLILNEMSTRLSPSSPELARAIQEAQQGLWAKA